MSDGTLGNSAKATYGYSVWPVRGGQNGVISIPKTGQTTAYDTNTPKRDDGALQTGLSFPSPRFTNNGDGRVTDNLTGFMWAQNANLAVASMNWQPALNYVAGMNAGTYSNFGYTDWRLPNSRELRSLANYGQTDMATWLNTQGFTNAVANYYWSSTTYAPNTTSAWIVYMSLGNKAFNTKASLSYYVWPVRGGQ